MTSSVCVASKIVPMHAASLHAGPLLLLALAGDAATKDYVDGLFDPYTAYDTVHESTLAWTSATPLPVTTLRWTKTVDDSFVAVCMQWATVTHSTATTYAATISPALPTLDETLAHRFPIHVIDGDLPRHGWVEIAADGASMEFGVANGTEAGHFRGAGYATTIGFDIAYIPADRR